jgi:hypothetical protein
VLIVEFGLFHNDLVIRVSHCFVWEAFLQSTYVGSEGETEGDIATDENTAMFFLIPTTLSKPQP